MEAGKPPPDAAWLQELQQAFFTQRCLHAIARLGVADLLVQGPLAVAEIAEQCGADPDALARILRFLASRGVFSETAPATYALNARAALFRSDTPHSARWHFMHDLPARSAAGILHSVRTGEPAFDKLHGRSLWAYLADHPDESDWFNRHMQAQAMVLAMPVVENYDWSGCKVVVDVGGGTGQFISALLQRHPHLSGVLVDRPEVVAGAIHADRLRIVPGDFFEQVPALGDTYVLSRVLHDWDDDRAIQILRTVKAAMPAGARLLILELIVPEEGGPHPAKMLDIAMLVQFGGRERTEAEFAALLGKASLSMMGISRPGGPTSLIEAQSN